MERQFARLLVWHPSFGDRPWSDTAEDANWTDAEAGRRIKWAEGDLAVLDSRAAAMVDVVAPSIVFEGESYRSEDADRKTLDKVG